MRSRSSRETISEAKVQALRKALAEGLQVTFKNRSTVKRRKLGGIEVVRRHGRATFPRVYGSRQLPKAYDYALNGETPAENAARPRRGPCWHDPDKLRPSHPELGECPF